MTRTLNTLIIVFLVTVFSVVSSYAPVAKAAVISTETILNQQTRSTQHELQNILAREDVREELVRLGVDPEYAHRRIAALTDSEVAQIQQHIDELPAGSDALAILGAVFLVLLVLELVGVTNVFSKL